MADSGEGKRAVKRKAKLEARKQKQVLNCVLWKPFPSNTIDLLWFFTTLALIYSAVQSTLFCYLSLIFTWETSEYAQCSYYSQKLITKVGGRC